MNWIYNNTEEYFYVDIADFLSNRNIEFSDIDDVKFIIKTKKSDSDDEAKILKYLYDDVVKDSTRNYIAIKFRSADFDDSTLENSNQYYMGLAIKTPSMSDYLEIEFTDNRLIVTSSFFD